MYVVYNVLYTNSTSESVFSEEDSSFGSGASVLDFILSLDESMDGAAEDAAGCPGLKLGFKVILGRLFLLDWDAFAGSMDEDGRLKKLRLEDVANNFFNGLIPEVCCRILGAGLSTAGVLFSGSDVLCFSGMDESKSGSPNPSLTVCGSRLLGSLKNDDRVGTIFGTMKFLVAVLNVFLGLNITTVSSIVVVKSTKPT